MDEHRGYNYDYERILAALKATGYQVEARVLDAQWLGIPQRRKRVIFMGARSLAPALWPRVLPYRYTVREATGLQMINDTAGIFSQGDVTNAPMPTVTAGVDGINRTHFKVRQGGEWRPLTPLELRFLSGFPADYWMPEAFKEQWQVVAMSVLPLMMRAVAAKVQESLDAEVA